MKKINSFLFIVLPLALGACGGNKRETTGEDQYNSDKEIISHASLLSIEDREGYDLVTIKTSPEDKFPVRYALISNLVSEPADLPAGTLKINVPVSSAVIDSEVYASIIDELSAGGVIRGMFDTSFISSPSLVDRVRKNDIIDVGSPSAPNREKIIALAPDLITLSYFTGMDARNLDNLGIPVLKMADLNESTPLGRAEWIKLFGRLVGQGEKADSIFEVVSTDYENLRQKASIRKHRPKVLTEQVYEGVWYVSGGDSYQARLIKDAGGEYFMESDNHTGSLNLSMEQVLERGNDADIWLIKVFGENLTKESLTAKDKRYTRFKPFQTGDIYISDTSKNSLFRDFPFHPELLLKEYIQIFSSDDGSPELVYFKKISQ